MEQTLPSIPPVQQTNETLNIEELMKKYCTEFNESQTMEEILPRQFTSQQQLEKITSNLYYTKTQSHLNSLTEALSKPIWDLLDRGGKRWRPILCMIVAEVFGYNRKYVYDIASLCQMVHNGTLIVDDIEDSSETRRDKKCVHLIYGVDISVNAGNFIYFAPMMRLYKSGKYSAEQLRKMALIYLEEMTSLHVGQGWDIAWHNHLIGDKYPSENDYLQMTAHKTGVLARLSVRLTCVAIGLDDQKTKPFARLAQSMGVAFQIQDDLLNLQGDEYKKTKGYLGEDIHQGKMTLMVLHAIKHSPHSKRLIEILKMKTEKQELITEAINILRESKSLDYAREVMKRLIDESWKEAEPVLPAGKYTDYLRQLVYVNLVRKK